MKRWLILFFVFSSLFSVSQNINVRIFSGNTIESFVFYAKDGRYDFVQNNTIVCTLFDGQSAIVTKSGTHVHVGIGENSYIIDSLLLIRGATQNNKFQIRFKKKILQAREYDNDLYVKIDKKGLVLINDVNFEKYIAGVVESEGGAEAGIEYYKAQAVLCRTYATKFYNRHIKSGYNLCDGVHCQAYVGRCRYSKAIVEAVQETTNIVLVDEQNNLIEATFYSNSGGETCNSELVWNKSIPYLRGKADPYSEGQKAAEWTYTIPRKQWEVYLFDKGIPLSDSADLSFEQPTRKKYLTTDCSDSLLLLTTIRNDWKLRSTFFCIDSRENVVVLHGKGFGHGVGLSQEGAMEMARQGFSYEDILKFYYTNVHLSNIYKMKFFQFIK